MWLGSKCRGTWHPERALGLGSGMWIWIWVSGGYTCHPAAPSADDSQVIHIFSNWHSRTLFSNRIWGHLQYLFLYLYLYLYLFVILISYSQLYLLWLAVRISGFPFTTRQLTFHTPSRRHTLAHNNLKCLNFFVSALRSFGGIFTPHVANQSDTFSVFSVFFWWPENFSRKLWVHAKWLTFRRSFRYRFKLDQRCWTTNAFLSTSTWFRYFRYSARLHTHRRAEHTDTHFGSSTPRKREREKESERIA